MPKFTFATEVEGFDTHIENSIRGYTDLRKDVLKFSEYFVEPGSTVVDIGCSTGKLIREMKAQNDRFADGCIYIGIELETDFSQNFVTTEDNLSFRQSDVCDFQWQEEGRKYCLVLSIFTLQFLPKDKRQSILNEIYSNLSYGGAFIFSEKIFSPNAQLEEMMTFCYYDWKRGYFDNQQILDKETELRHMMKPLTFSDTTEMLTKAGFSTIQSFWQNFNFIAAIALKT